MGVTLSIDEVGEEGGSYMTGSVGRVENEGLC